MRKIAVFGGTAHPALAAEICADLLTRQEPLKRGIPAFWPGDRLHRIARARHPSKGGMLSTWPDEAASGLHQLREHH